MDTRPQLVLKNVTLPDGRIADITTGNGTVTHIGAGPSCDAIIDCSGLLVLPGATDIHVHMRGNSQSEKEDWRSGSRSALAGGVTLVVDQPNTIPPLTTQKAFNDRVRDAAAHSLCHFAVNSALTRDTDVRSMWRAGAMAFGEVFFGPSSYGDAVDAETLERSLASIRTFDGLATIHAEKVSQRPGGDLAGHERARPVSGEVDAIREVSRCNKSGCRLHFCHLSTAAAIDAVTRGSREVTPHHLFLSQETFGNQNDADGKVNPPLRSEKERSLLWSRWDRIDVIASDHAPHTAGEKRASFPIAPSGIPGVETMLPLLVAEVLERRITTGSLIRKTVNNPAAILGVRKAGFGIGDRADFALYRKAPVQVRVEDLHSRCGWTPYEGMRAVFPKTVIMDGMVVYTQGEFYKGSPSWFAGRGFYRPK